MKHSIFFFLLPLLTFTTMSCCTLFKFSYVSLFSVKVFTVYCFRTLNQPCLFFIKSFHYSNYFVADWNLYYRIWCFHFVTVVLANTVTTCIIWHDISFHVFLCFLKNKKNKNKKREIQIQRKEKESKNKLNRNASGPEVIYFVTQLQFLARLRSTEAAI